VAKREDDLQPHSKDGKPRTDESYGLTLQHPPPVYHSASGGSSLG
jgi:hypothetical protein